MSARRIARWLALLVAALAITAAACQPPKPPGEAPPVPGRHISSYLWRDFSAPGTVPATSFYRSAVPGTHPAADGSGEFTQRFAGQFPVLETSNLPVMSSATNGFVTPMFRLGDFDSARLQLFGGSSLTTLGLLFDAGGDGELLAFDAAGRSTGYDGDEIGTTFATENLLIIDGDRVLSLEPFVVGCAGNTIDQLTAGTCAGIDADTMVALYVTMFGAPDEQAVIASLQLNGNELL
jgi:hypothetical protein